MTDDFPFPDLPRYYIVAAVVPDPRPPLPVSADTPAAVQNAINHFEEELYNLIRYDHAFSSSPATARDLRRKDRSQPRHQVQVSSILREQFSKALITRGAKKQYAVIAWPHELHRCYRTRRDSGMSVYGSDGCRIWTLAIPVTASELNSSFVIPQNAENRLWYLLLHPSTPQTSTRKGSTLQLNLALLRSNHGYEPKPLIDSQPLQSPTHRGRQPEMKMLQLLQIYPIRMRRNKPSSFMRAHPRWRVAAWIGVNAKRCIIPTISRHSDEHIDFMRAHAGSGAAGSENSGSQEMR